MTRYDNFIGGAYVPTAAYGENRNPSDHRDLIGEYARSEQSDVDAAIDAAHRAFPAWAATPPAQRSEYLHRIARGIADREVELADMLAREEGKTLAEALGEVRRAASTFTYYAGEILHAHGASYAGLGSKMTIEAVHRPVGVVGIIAPWNFPIAIPAWKSAPALAYGNTVVLKPADLVPGTAWLLADVIRAAGLPDGVFNLVMGPGRVVGARFTESPLIAAISFTGSTAVGTGVAAAAVQNGLKKVQLELGGKNPLIVMPDADLDIAVASALEGAYAATGQRCTAASRLIVHDDVHDAFVDAMVARLAGYTVGDSRAEGTTMGPVVSESQLQQDLDYIEIGRQEGGELVAGGELAQHEQPGNFLLPTLFVGTQNSWRINQEEIFGPVASVIRFGDYEEAVTIANDVEYGLSSAIVTRSLAHAHDFAARSQAGMVSINRSPAGSEYHVPFGGRKASSYGSREQGTAAREFFTTTTTVYTMPGEV